MIIKEEQREYLESRVERIKRRLSSTGKIDTADRVAFIVMSAIKWSEDHGSSLLILSVAVSEFDVLLDTFDDFGIDRFVYAVSSSVATETLVFFLEQGWNVSGTHSFDDGVGKGVLIERETKD